MLGQSAARRLAVTFSMDCARMVLVAIALVSAMFGPAVKGTAAAAEPTKPAPAPTVEGEPPSFATSDADYAEYNPLAAPPITTTAQPAVPGSGPLSLYTAPPGCCPYHSTSGEMFDCGAGSVNGCHFQCASGACCGQCCPTWTVRAEAIALQRAGGPERTLVSGPGGEPLLRTEDQEFGWGWGPKISVIYHTPCALDWEVTYFGIVSWTANDVAADPAAAIFDGAGFSAIDLTGEGIHFEYDSDLHSTEINARRPVSEDLALLAGFRWVEVHEELRGDFVIDGSRFYATDVDNHLYGFQLGAEATLLRRDRFRIDGMVKAGIFGTEVDQDSVSPLLGAHVFAEHSVTSFLGELGLYGVYRLSPRIWLRGGYQALWLDGLGLAANQIDAVNLPAGTGLVDTDGSLFYHGFTFGMEACF